MEIDWQDPEFLRYLAILLLGIVLAVSGLTGFWTAGQMESEIAGITPTAQELAPETVPTLESIEGQMVILKIVSVILFLIGLVVGYAGFASLKEFSERDVGGWTYSSTVWEEEEN